VHDRNHRRPAFQPVVSSDVEHVGNKHIQPHAAATLHNKRSSFVNTTRPVRLQIGRSLFIQYYFFLNQGLTSRSEHSLRLLN